jgi:hypothetical protein
MEDVCATLTQLRVSGADASEPAPHAEADADASATLTLLSLPHFLIFAIFALLPVDARLLAAAVCRSWRAVLSERSLWTRLDVSRTSGVTRRITPALFKAACARARAAGGLQALDVSGDGAALLTLEAVVVANACTLRELRVCNGTENFGSVLDFSVMLNLLRAAPQLQLLEADILCTSIADASSAVRATERDGVSLRALRVHGLHVNDSQANDASIVSLCTDVASNASLTELILTLPRCTDAALDAIVDAALACPVHTFFMFARTLALSRASAPALARLLGGSTLRDLRLFRHMPEDQLDVPAATLLADALRANSTLHVFQFFGGRIWREAAAADVLLCALVGHPSLRTVGINDQDCAGHEELAGAVLGALVAANAPSLTALTISRWDGGGAMLRPLFAALPHNTHLLLLNVSGNHFSEAFARNELLPAVRANTSLRFLSTGALELAGAREAEELVERRLTGR